MRRIKTAVLISGRGSNMVSLVEASKQKSYPAEITLVISNIPDAPGLSKARALGVMAMAIDHKSFPNRKAFDIALNNVLQEAGIELVCCAGFMRILAPEFTSIWEGKGDEEHGCTIHYVTQELDSGDTILQRRIQILENDTAETLAKRLLPIELDAYPTALKMVASHQVRKY